MKILVTGAGGFIGVNLCKLLHREGHSVIAYSRQFPADPEMKTFSQGGCEVVMANVLNPAQLYPAIDRADAVVHLAGFTSVPDSIRNPRGCITENVIGTFNVLDRCAQSKIEPVVIASSGAALLALSPYGASKAAAAALATAYRTSYDLNAITLAFSNVYGPHSIHKQSVVAKLCYSVATGQPFDIHGNGEQRRDFIHVRDVCQAILAALVTDTTPESGYYIGTGKTTSIMDLLRYLEDAYDDVDGFCPIDIRHLPEQPGNVMEPNIPSIEPAMRDLNWRPTIPVARGIALTYDWYIGNFIGTETAREPDTK